MNLYGCCSKPFCALRNMTFTDYCFLILKSFNIFIFISIIFLLSLYFKISISSAPGAPSLPNTWLVKVNQPSNHVEMTIILQPTANLAEILFKNHAHSKDFDLTRNQHYNESYHVMSSMPNSNQTKIQSLNQIHPGAVQASTSRRCPEYVICFACYAIDARRTDQYRCIVCPMESTQANEK